MSDSINVTVTTDVRGYCSHLKEMTSIYATYMKISILGDNSKHLKLISVDCPHKAECPHSEVCEVALLKTY